MESTVGRNKVTDRHWSMLREPSPAALKWTFILLLGSSLVEGTIGWTYHYSTFKKMNWSEARLWCQTYYTDLVVIQSQEENDYLVNTLQERSGTPYYWIGIQKNLENGIWTWVGNNNEWIGDQLWAENEPNNPANTELCVEIYVNRNKNRGKWNDEKCSSKKYPACFKAQCNETSCGEGRCTETINNIMCHCPPSYEGDKCQTVGEDPEKLSHLNFSLPVSQLNLSLPVLQVVESVPQSQPTDGFLNCSAGQQMINSTCPFSCSQGFQLLDSAKLICTDADAWNGQRPICISYKLAVIAVAGCGIFSSICIICLCCIKHRKRKTLAQPSDRPEVASPEMQC